jgi:hypothetical protein
MTPVPKNIAKNAAKLRAYKRNIARGYNPRIAAALANQGRKFLDKP